MADTADATRDLSPPTTHHAARRRDAIAAGDAASQT